MPSPASASLDGIDEMDCPPITHAFAESGTLIYVIGFDIDGMNGNRCPGGRPFVLVLGFRVVDSRSAMTEHA